MTPAQFADDVVATVEQVADLDRVVATLAVVLRVLLLIVVASENLFVVVLLLLRHRTVLVPLLLLVRPATSRRPSLATSPRTDHSRDVTISHTCEHLLKTLDARLSEHEAQTYPSLAAQHLQTGTAAAVSQHGISFEFRSFKINGSSDANTNRKDQH